MRFEIRAATHKDFEGMKLVNDFFTKGLPYDNPDWFLEESIQNKKTLIVLHKEKIIGYLIYQIIWGNAPFISLIRIFPEFQRKKIGSTLVKNLEQKLKKEGYSFLLSSSENTKQSARKFHEKLGFSEVGKMEDITDFEIFFRKAL